MTPQPEDLRTKEEVLLDEALKKVQALELELVAERACHAKDAADTKRLIDLAATAQAKVRELTEEVEEEGRAHADYQRHYDVERVRGDALAKAVDAFSATCGEEPTREEFRALMLAYQGYVSGAALSSPGSARGADEWCRTCSSSAEARALVGRGACNIGLLTKQPCRMKPTWAKRKPCGHITALHCEMHQDKGDTPWQPPAPAPASPASAAPEDALHDKPQDLKSLAGVLALGAKADGLDHLLDAERAALAGPGTLDRESYSRGVKEGYDAARRPCRHGTPKVLCTVLCAKCSHACPRHYWDGKICQEGVPACDCTWVEPSPAPAGPRGPTAFDLARDAAIRIRDLHGPDTADTCQRCNRRWPCSTRTDITTILQVLDGPCGVVGAPAQPEPAALPRQPTSRPASEVLGPSGSSVPGPYENPTSRPASALPLDCRKCGPGTTMEDYGDGRWRCRLCACITLPWDAAALPRQGARWQVMPYAECTAHRLAYPHEACAPDEVCGRDGCPWQKGHAGQCPAPTAGAEEPQREPTKEELRWVHHKTSPETGAPLACGAPISEEMSWTTDCLDDVNCPACLRAPPPVQERPPDDERK